jgi:uncharacterized membrane protein
LDASLYNPVAGQSVERLAALSVLDLRRILIARLVVLLKSSMTLGVFWIGRQTQLDHFARSDRNLAWSHISFLCAVSLTPFSTSLLAKFIHSNRRGGRCIAQSLYPGASLCFIDSYYSIAAIILVQVN